MNSMSTVINDIANLFAARPLENDVNVILGRCIDEITYLRASMDAIADFVKNAEDVADMYSGVLDLVAKSLAHNQVSK